MLTTTAEQDLAVEVTQHQTGTVITVRGAVDVLSLPPAGGGAGPGHRGLRVKGRGGPF
jgi:hypothetical protein